MIVVSEVMVKEAAGIPPKLTAVATLKLAPVMTTVVPAYPESGEKELMEGPIYTKPGEVVDPPGVVTDTSPVAPESTCAIKSVGEYTVTIVAGTPPKETVAPGVKFVPMIVMFVPLVPYTGEKEVTEGGEGGSAKVKRGKLAVPFGVTIVTSPEDPEPITAVMEVGETFVKDAAGTPPKSTAVAPPRLTPVMVTVDPAAAVSGEIVLIPGRFVVFSSRVIEFAVKFATARSGMSSPLRSLMAMP